MCLVCVSYPIPHNSSYISPSDMERLNHRNTAIVSLLQHFDVPNAPLCLLECCSVRLPGMINRVHMTAFIPWIIRRICSRFALARPLYLPNATLTASLLISPLYVRHSPVKGRSSSPSSSGNTGSETHISPRSRPTKAWDNFIHPTRTVTNELVWTGHNCCRSSRSKPPFLRNVQDLHIVKIHHPVVHIQKNCARSSAARQCELGDTGIHNVDHEFACSDISSITCGDRSSVRLFFFCRVLSKTAVLLCAA